MTKPGFIIGVIILSISGFMFLAIFLMIYAGDGGELEYKYMFYCIISGVVGGILISANATSRQERQDYEDYKRARAKENAIYYRYKDAKGTPFEEYNMDDRTKLTVYYDRLPYDLKKKVIDDVDRIYRKYINDLYTKK